MKIGTKISLFYTSVTFAITLFIILVFYVFTSRYVDKLFQLNLADKAYLSAQKNWEKDEVDPKSYRLILEEYNELLPRAREVLLNKDSLPAMKDSLNKYLSPKEQAKLYEGDPVFFNKHKLRGVALYYPDNQGKFVVLIMAHNKYGYNIQQHTLVLSLILLLISSVVVFIMGRIYSENIMLPLKNLLQHLKQIRGNNLNFRLKEAGNKDELDALIHTLNEMLDRINEAFKSEKSFVSCASHELNNPLTAIQGECEISLMKQRTPEEYIESLQRISTESQRLSQLVKQLMFLSRHDEDLLIQERSPIRLNDFLKNMVQKNSRIVFSNETDIKEDIILSANPYLLEIALENFLSNACKYSQGDVDLRLKLTAEADPFIEIEDYGIGIPEAEVFQIFQSFYRASNTRAYSGNGIGLSLSFKILSAYGAKISVDTEENVHTKFTIIFSDIQASDNNEKEL